MVSCMVHCHSHMKQVMLFLTVLWYEFVVFYPHSDQVQVVWTVCFQQSDMM